MTRDLRQELVLLLVGAVVVKLLFPFRHDLPAHVVGGGAAAVVAVTMVPRRVADRLGDGVLGIGLALVILLAWSTERFLFGPFDLVDVAFTVAGAVAVVDVGTAAAADGSQRRQVLAWNIALVGLALVYRYGLSS